MIVSKLSAFKDRLNMGLYRNFIISKNQLTKSDMENDHNMLVQVLTRYIQKLTAIRNNMTESDIDI